MEPYRGTITEPGLPAVFSVFAGGREGGWGGWGLLNGKGVVIGESGLFLRGNSITDKLSEG